MAAEHFQCDFNETTPISFRTNYADDYLHISITGDSCEAGTIEVSITTDDDKLIHYDKAEYKVDTFDLAPGENFESHAKWYVGRISTFAIDSSSRLAKATGVCFPDYNNCAIPNFSAVSKERYLQIKEGNIPMFSQPRPGGSWEYYVYDHTSGKSILVAYGGH